MKFENRNKQSLFNHYRDELKIRAELINNVEINKTLEKAYELLDKEDLSVKEKIELRKLLNIVEVKAYKAIEDAADKYRLLACVASGLNDFLV